MDTKLKLIKEAQSHAMKMETTNKTICENINVIAKDVGTTSTVVFESITHVLAGLPKTASAMNPRSVASLLAGVERLSSALANAQDSTSKQNTIKVLSAAAMQFDQFSKDALPNEAVVKIAQYGSKFPDAVQKYMQIASDPKQLSTVAHKLQTLIDQAMRSSQGSTVSSNPAASLH